MTLDELIVALEIAEDKKGEAGNIVKKFLDEAYVPKSRYDNVEEEKKTLQATISERDKQLVELKKNAGDNEDLKKQIRDLQDANKAAKTEYDEKMKDMRLSTAIQIAIAADAQDVGIVSGLFDKSKLILGDDGKVTGLDEQLTALKKDKPFLFKDGKPKGKGYEPNGGGGPLDKNPFAKENFNLTEQGKILRENPEQARALAAAAGVTI
ncbi:phage scaffolding protein [Megasphaera elsdenii]|uniref:phage scaffolding protein n=1 Tax=Megasphaera elsdenii TaxID=907 RepID=UPI001956C9C9|nr:phage scaffolding protein [Megasphaera elsdenii]MBM6701758.1 phage scaffolding protein [Megasphaera elsdenii]